MTPLTPRELYGELFELVQMRRVFADSKTFADAVPRSDPVDIMRVFEQQRQQPGFDLERFVSQHFMPAGGVQATGCPSEPTPIRERLESLWRTLSREDDPTTPPSSKINLPHPYVVPGGRFDELYYWDSYFTMLGLVASGKRQVARDMVDNFALLIDRFGFIPNSSRTYHLSRSQPPFFALMVELLASSAGDDSVYKQRLPRLKREYAFWMSGSESLTGLQAAVRRVVSNGEAALNRYWDDSDLPREESFLEDRELAAFTTSPHALWREIRAACESGWDFSSRWLANGRSMQSLHTTQVIPVDLNALIFKLETVLAHACELAGETRQAGDYLRRAEQRKSWLQSLFFSEEENFFVDLAWPGLESTGRLSLAAAYPLFFGIATQAQAARAAHRLKQDFLKPGGWVTSLVRTGQQWDAPNGWAPLQWLVFEGLGRYGFHELAQAGAERWIDAVLHTYRTTGRLLEKYDVEQPGRVAGGGEYAVQDGFGWTNGVLLALAEQTGRSLV